MSYRGSPLGISVGPSSLRICEPVSVHFVVWPFRLFCIHADTPMVKWQFAFSGIYTLSDSSLCILLWEDWLSNNTDISLVILTSVCVRVGGGGAGRGTCVHMCDKRNCCQTWDSSVVYLFLCFFKFFFHVVVLHLSFFVVVVVVKFELLFSPLPFRNFFLHSCMCSFLQSFIHVFIHLLNHFSWSFVCLFSLFCLFFFLMPGHTQRVMAAPTWRCPSSVPRPLFLQFWPQWNSTPL